VNETVEAGSIWIRLGLNTDELRFGLDKAKYGLQEWRGETNKNSMEMAQWGAAIAAEAAPVVAIGAVILDATTKAGAFGKTIKDNARDIGLTTDEYQQWSHAAVVAGGDANAMTESVRMMTVRMKEAVDPTSDIGKQFADLGVKVTDSGGNMRNTNDVLLDTFAALNKLPEGFARNQAQMQIFGRGFSNISDLAGMTREELQALLDQAPIIDSDKIQKMDEFNTKLALVNEEWKIMYAELGTELIPVVEELMPLISDYGIPAIGGLATILEWAGRGFHIMGAEAKAAYEVIINRDLGAAKKDMQDLANWIQSQQTADALKSAGYTEGAYWDGTKWVKPAKPGSKAPDVTDKGAAKTAEQAEKDRVSALVDAWKEYQDQIKNVQDEKKALYNLDKEYYEDVMGAGRDLGAIRSLTKSHERARSGALDKLSTSGGLQSQAAQEFGMIAGGIAPEKVPGTKEYETAQAKAAGALTLTINGGVHLTNPADWPALMEKITSSMKINRIQGGVRTAQ
jgi:uncharacterized protein (UPF0335 family)